MNTEPATPTEKSLHLPKPPKLRKLRKVNRRATVIVAVIIVAAIVGGQFAYGKVFGSSAAPQITEHTVSRGDIRVVITGSGSVEPAEMYNVVPLVKGEILADYFSEGDVIEKGQLLYEIDSSDAQTNIEKSSISLQKAQLSYRQALDSANSLEVVSTISGVITEMTAKVGDNVQNNSTVAKVLDTGSLILKIPFIAEDAARLYVGQSARIVLSETGETLNGRVAKTYTGSYISSTGAIVSDVEITFSNPGSVTTDESATAVVGDFACNAAGTLTYASSASIVAKTSGEVTKVYASKGDYVRAGETILSLSSDTATMNVDSAALSVKDAELSLQNTYDTLDNYHVTSPISGTVIQKSSKAGDTLDNNSSTKMAVIADMSSLSFTVDIDELDISNIEVGQSVTVTADALSNKIFNGKVSKKSIIGSSSNGVTSYPITIIIEEYEGLLPGMNVNAQIVVEEKTDVLRIPVAAVSRGNYVLVKTDSETAKKAAAPADNSEKDAALPNQTPQAAQSDETPANVYGQADSAASRAQAGNKRNGGAAPQAVNDSGQNNVQIPDRLASSAPDGYAYVLVTLGINDENYIEVLGGLAEGDVVGVVTVASQTAPVAAVAAAQGFGGIGMTGAAGMPGGGNRPMG